MDTLLSERQWLCTAPCHAVGPALQTSRLRSRIKVPLCYLGSCHSSLWNPAGGQTKNRFLYGNSKEFGGRSGRDGVCNKAVANEALVRCLPELRELINRQMRAKLSSEPLYQYSHYRGCFQQFQRINNKCYIITADLLLSSLPVFCRCLLNPLQPTASSPPASAPLQVAQPWHQCPGMHRLQREVKESSSAEARLQRSLSTC